VTFAHRQGAPRWCQIKHFVDTMIAPPALNQKVGRTTVECHGVTTILKRASGAYSPLSDPRVRKAT
jgi:hypothetical protein